MLAGVVRPVSWILSVAALAACGGSGGEPSGPACVDPARGPAAGRFRDVTAQSGVDFLYTTTGFQGGGLAVADLDGDGLPEIVAGRRSGGAAVFRNRGGLRFEEAIGAGLDPAVAVHAIAAADLDNDGDRDLVLAGPGAARVLAGRGDGGFDLAARLAGTGVTEHVLPVDLDGDGLLELYFSNYDIRSDANTQNRLYSNRGGLVLEAAAGTFGAGLSWTATALDADGDGDQDLYVANDTLVADFGKPAGPPEFPWPVDLLLRNDGPGPDGAPRFTDIAAAVGLDTPRSSMGGVLGDLDGDGRLDLYVPDLGANELFVQGGAGRFGDRGAELGVAALARRSAVCGPDPTGEECLLLSWSAAVADFDLDGFDELLVVNGETSPGDAPPVVMFARGAEPAYREVAPEIPCLDARGLVATDLDGDGDQDVVIGPREGPLAIYENRGAPAATAWLRVALRGRVSNRDGVGAIVTARLASGRTVPRAIGAGGVIHAASPPEAVFGLAGGDEIEAIEVRWPSGRRTEVIRPAAGALVLEEP